MPGIYRRAADKAGRMFDKLYLARRRAAAESAMRRSARPYRLHLGCGEVRFEGWVNIDSRPVGAADAVWDLSLGIPVEDCSCSMIYCEHLLEHLSVEQGLRFLRECRRALAAGGVLRIAMPSLDVLLEKSCGGDWREQDWLSWPNYRFIKTRAEMLNVSFRWWGHQWLYDREELWRRLGEAGFTDLKEAGWGLSEEPALKGRETRKDSLLICEARK
ncbi:MAG: methyltransferase domain-containing protein [Nitrospirae bacterium]|nr:methyltransferase domain-containing protein [Nitrospirota bacterium]MBI5696862.1 methyltransferase domain-containing protein [Nitrospirota bacterium]